ncbi:MAG: carboxylesterase family protein [Actinomycetia bacterium]|nr:carboxylesterase family protein [Actinomycetes bacterium]
MARRDAPVVDTAAGAIRGAWKDGGAIAVFRGVPYAAPPTGDRRWRRPEDVEPWSGERAAVKDGPQAFQRATSIEDFMEALANGQGWSRARAKMVNQIALRMPKPKESEDCLYLTVRTPDMGSGAKLPVMVWIHGGDHQDGSGSEVFYASNALASHGVVTVSINYRLGLMGYFAHPELAAESEQGVAGNYGTHDQIAALRWVRDNIEAFGGDPGNVTIFGESAGGESVVHLMTSPLARGLFHRAVAQSPANGGQMIHLRSAFLDRDSAEKTSSDFAAALGITGPNQLDRLRGRSADELYALVRTAQRLGDHYPVIDGHVLPESPLAAFAGSRQADVPLMIGSNTDEGTLIRPMFGAPMVDFRYRPLPETSLQDEIAGAFGDDLESLLGHYPGLDRRDVQAETDFLGDHMFGAKAYWYARHHAAAGHPTWLYQFARTPPHEGQTAGAYHAAELAFVHGSSVPILPLTAEDKILAAEMQAYWTNFAAAGDPNHTVGSDGRPVAWPAFDGSDPRWLRLDHTIMAGPVDRAERYEVLNARTSRLVTEMATLNLA